MLEYGNLSPVEFEYVCQDVMQARLQAPLRRFPSGRDDGIDLIGDCAGSRVVVQVKHYWKSPFSALKRALKVELPKLERLRPDQYFICCAQTLSPRQVKELYELFSSYMASERNIITLLEIDDFLCDADNIGILRKHFKLWLSATNILSELCNQDIFIDSEALLYDSGDELPYYVQTGSYLKSRDILESERMLMIVGSPGVGKTTVSKMLALYFASQGYRVRYAANGEVSDVKRAISAGEGKEFILLDDCLGQCYFRLKDTQENELSSLIKYVKRHPGKMLLLNSRVTIFNEAREHSPEFAQLFDRGAVRIRRIDAEDIPPDEKALILYALMRKFRVPDRYYQSIRKDRNYRRIVNHQNYNPRIIEYAAWRYRDAEGPEHFFDFLMDKLQSPKNVWKDEFERRLSQTDRYFMYTLYSLAVPSACVPADALKNAFRTVLQALQADISVDQFENALARLSRSLVRIVSRERRSVYTREPYYRYFVRGEGAREITVLNPSVNDYLREVFLEPSLRDFFKTHACYVEQIIHMCETASEVDEEIEKLARGDGGLERIRAMDPALTQPIILYFLVRLGILDDRYQGVILPGLAQFPNHYYISRAFMISHRKFDVIQALWKEPLYSFYRVRDKLNGPQGVKALCGELDLKSLVAVGNWLNSHLTFDGHWRREDFLAILREELQDAGQCYLDARTLDYDRETGESFDSYCVGLEDDLYEQLEQLEMDEIRYEDFDWSIAEWDEQADLGWKENVREDLRAENEIDLILDRSVE